MKANVFFASIFLSLGVTITTGMVTTGFHYTLLLYLAMSIGLVWAFLTVDDDLGRTVWGEIKRYRSRRRHRRQLAKHKRRQARIMEFKYKPLNR